MPTAPNHHDAHDYAERIRERLPKRNIAESVARTDFTVINTLRW